MVRKKRVAVKDAGDAEKIESIAKDEGLLPVGAEVLLRPPIVEEPKPTLLSSEETAWTLLDAAPPVPYITTVEQAVAFVDKYARWKRDVEGTKR